MKTELIARERRNPLWFSRNSIQSGVLVVLSYALLFISLLFSVEIALILLGIGDITLPWTSRLLDLFNRLAFR